MKYLSVLVLTLSVFFGSCNNAHEGYEIKGTLDNGAGKTIYLDELNMNRIDPLDSAVIDNEGNFVFRGVTNEPIFVNLRLGPNNFASLLIDSLDKVTITGDADRLNHTYQVEGSVECKLIKELSSGLNNTSQKIDSIVVIYESNINNTAIDSIKQELDSVFEQIMTDHRRTVREFVRKHPSSLSTLMALYQRVKQYQTLTFEMDMDLYELVDDSLIIRYPDSKHVKASHALLIKVKAQMEDQKASEHVRIGGEAPDITLPTPEGDTISLSSLRGNYVLLDFWGSWCRPCRGENPNLVLNYKKYHDKGFEIFQVSVEKSHEAWINAIRQDNLSSWHHVSDLQFWNSPAVKLYKVQGIPANFLIDKEGKIIATNLRGSALGEKLAEVLLNPKSE